MKASHQRRVWMLCCIAVAIVVAACAGSTTIEQSWRAPQLSGLRNVVTVYISRDTAMRRTVEDSMARRLAGEGVRAVPAYSILSDADTQDREGAKAKLLAAGYDGVVALRLVGKETKVEVTPPIYTGYWGPAWGGAYQPGYLSTETVVRVETSVYALGDGKLVWSGLSKTVDPSSMKSTIDGRDEGRGQDAPETTGRERRLTHFFLRIIGNCDIASPTAVRSSASCAHDVSSGFNRAELAFIRGAYVVANHSPAAGSPFAACIASPSLAPRGASGAIRSFVSRWTTASTALQSLPACSMSAVTFSNATT